MGVTFFCIKIYGRVEGDWVFFGGELYLPSANSMT